MHRRLGPIVALTIGALVTSLMPAHDPALAVQVVSKLHPAMPALGDVSVNDRIQPAVSADGRFVVFVADADTDGADELWSVRVDGAQPPRRLGAPLPSGSGVDQFIITPNGNFVVYLAPQDSAGVTELYVAPVSGGGVSRKLNDPLVAGGDVENAVVSPDGTRVVYQADQVTDGRSEIFSVSLGGGGSAKLNGPLALGGAVSTPVITPDSSRVVYQGDQQTNSLFELYSVPIDGGSFETISDGANVVTSPIITPDGTAVVFLATLAIPSVTELFSAPVSGGAAIQLSTPLPVGHHVSDLRVSPDGSTVVYTADETVIGGDELFSVSVAGGSPTKLSTALVAGGSVSSGAVVFSLGGSRVVYLADQFVDDVFELFSVPIGGGAPIRLSPPLPPGGDVNAVATTIAAGNRVVYSADHDADGVLDVFSVPVLGGASTRLNAPLGGDEQIETFTVTPDGGRVVFTVRESAIGRSELFGAPAAGGTPTKLNATLTAGGSVDRFFLSAALDGVLYVADQDVDEVYELYLSTDDSPPSPAPPVDPPLTPLVPARLLDTRPGESTIDDLFEGIGHRTAGSVLELDVAGRGGVPTNATAAVINITAVGGDGPGFATAYPCDTARPLASSLNYAAGTATPNEVIAKLSAAGTLCVYALTGVDLIADVTGYASAVGAYAPLVPARLLDTRPGELTTDHQFEGIGRRAADSTLELPIVGRGGAAAASGAAVVNVTAVNAGAAGFATVYPCDSARPLASSLNYGAGSVSPNEIIARLSATGTICIYTLRAVDLIVDVSGTLPTGQDYTPVVPARLLDTRPGESTVDGQFAGSGRRAAGSTLELPVAGRGGLVNGVSAVVVNVTALEADTDGFVTVYPCDSPRPLASSVNYGPGDVVPNEVFATVSAIGTICLYTLETVDLIVDVTGAIATVPV